MRYVALDFETSGLDPKRHAPVSLGVALMEDQEILASREWLFAPPYDKSGVKVVREYDVTALEISGKSWTAIKRDGLTHARVCSELYDWSNKHEADELTVVAFNAPFDFAWYSELLMLGGSWNQLERRFQTFQPPLTGPWQCARLIACKRLDLPRYDLNTVAGAFDFSRTSAKHGALEDAILAGRVYEMLLECDRMGVTA